MKNIFEMVTWSHSLHGLTYIDPNHNRIYDSKHKKSVFKQRKMKASEEDSSLG